MGPMPIVLRTSSLTCVALLLLAGSGQALGQGPGAGVARVPEVPPSMTNPPAPPRPAEERAPEASRTGELQGPRRLLPITSFEVRYAEASRQIPRLPGVPELLAGAVVKLGRLPDGTFVARKDGGEPIDLRVGEFASPTPIMFDGGPEADLNDGGAIAAVTTAITAELRRRGVVGVFVTPIVAGVDAAGRTIDGEVDESLADVRKPAGRTSFRLEIFVAPVGEVRTLAIGDRVPVEERLNSPVHALIRKRSPVQVGDTIDRNLVDDYTLRLGRHPNRRVDVGVSPNSDKGDLSLDYLVSEAKPWQVILQLSNTGSYQTSQLRQRIGFQNTQLTGNDDVLRLDYLTSNFDSANALLGSYEMPFLAERLRLRGYGSYSEYSASEVGSSQDFNGESWLVGAELNWNFYQQREWFIDAVFGARYENIRTQNNTLSETGQSGFFIPSVGVVLSRNNEKWSTNAGVSLEFNVAGWGGTGTSQELLPLGRFAADQDFQIVRGNVEQSFFLEPLLAPDSFAGKGLGPGQVWQPGMTLAHEIYVGGKFFTSLDQRLVSNFQDVQGGLFTVRGYPENFVAGDKTVSLTGEYRLHIDRLLGVDPNNYGTFLGQPFRGKAQEPFGPTDWGVIVRAFCDSAVVYQSDKLPFENNSTLMSVGVGTEVQLWRNFNGRVDWGFPVRDETSNGRTVEAWDGRVSFIVTVIF